ncbi:MAG: hypothetical protein ACQKBT_09475, partial [Puniceicoccales bacterium]
WRLAGCQDLRPLAGHAFVRNGEADGLIGIMNEEINPKLPDHFAAGIVRLMNQVFANLINSEKFPAFPLQLRPYILDPDCWQGRAISHFTRTVSKGFSESRYIPRGVYYSLGFIDGAAQSAMKYVGNDEEMDEIAEQTELGKFVVEAGEQEEEDFDILSLCGLDRKSFSIKEEAEFLRGKSMGFRSLIKEDGSLVFESDRTPAYCIMLLMEDQMGYITTWKEFQKFISDFVPGYSGEGRFEACKKMGQDVGFYPSKEAVKNRAKIAGEVPTG